MKHLRLNGGESTLILSCEIGQPPRIFYWGAALEPSVADEQAELLTRRHGGIGNANISVPDSLTLEAGIGLVAGPQGLVLHRAGLDWAPRFVVTSVEKTGNKATMYSEDRNCRVKVTHAVEMQPESGVLTVTSAITNVGDDLLELVNPASVFFPVPHEATDIVSFSGRWAMEFQLHREPRVAGTWMRENRHGRTSHASFPGAILCDRCCNESMGQAWAIHLGWSGNHRVRVDTLPDGRAFANASVLAWPGELMIDPGASFETPVVYATYSASGFNGVSQAYHQHLRQHVLPPSALRPRPVHYNCWEGIYFDHDVSRLKEIASKAAEIGVERFVLDDGWFGARRHEQAGLGDWLVSKEVYPDGLHPLVNHVIECGMEMGIWFEPEMVNSDSDLFRAHPDWILQVQGVEQIPFRYQYVLDVARPEVADYLFQRISAILSEYRIDYIKWDMNRDLHHPGNHVGRPVAIDQVHATYALIDRIRAAHPHVEIESCSSGGGRIDFGILQRTERVWTSDTNDALDRQQIQRSASYFFPLSVLGAHAGPRDCHITGRVLSLPMRAATAFMGHMGLEMNLLTEPEEELQALQRMITLYRKHRSLIHGGRFFRLDFHRDYNVVCVVSDKADEAIFSIAQTASLAETHSPRLRFEHLDPAKQYRLELLSPASYDDAKYPTALGEILRSDQSISGSLLNEIGLQLPNGLPGSAIVLLLRSV